MVRHNAPQKDRERLYLQHFRKSFNEFPKGEVASSEAPDFLVNGGEGTVGVELTEYFRPPPEGARPFQEQESLWEQVTEKAERFYTQLGWPPVDVAVRPHPYHSLSPGSVESVGRRLAVAVRSRLPPVNSTLRVKDCWDDTLVPDAIHSFRIAHFEILENPAFHFGQGTFVPTLNVEGVQAQLDNKNPKCSNYRRSCDEAWLVVVIDGWRTSSTTDIGNDVRSARFDSEFDRAFLFECVGGKVTELETIEGNCD